MDRPRHTDEGRYEVRPAGRQDVDEVIGFNERILLGAGAAADPFTVSMRGELGYATDSLHGRNSFTTFVLVEVAGGRVIGRALVNTAQTPEDYDIAAYGARAARIVGTRRSAVFGGDLIDPAHRGKGLHALLIAARVAWLSDRGFEYVFVPILDGNRISLSSYMRWGVEYLGSRTVRYQVPVEVGLYGRPLAGMRARMAGGGDRSAHIPFTENASEDIATDPGARTHPEQRGSGSGQQQVSSR